MISLVEWYNLNKRNLPWRETTNPYNIWLSEVILQQTRVVQGQAYYHKFIEKYPNVKALSEAETDEVLKLWEGLGYYSRARNLLIAARQIMENYGGRFPESFDELKKIKGIGDYTAAAIASISFGVPVPVVDGNVYRVLSRLYAIEEPINSGKAKKLFFKLAGELLDDKKPGNYNNGTWSVNLYS
jgi:A/G-specific adenine glycosylase